MVVSPQDPCCVPQQGPEPLSDKGSQRSSGAWGSRGRRSKPGDSSLGDLKNPGETLEATQAKIDAKELEKESKEAQDEASS